MLILLVFISLTSVFIGVKKISVFEIFHLEDDKILVMLASRIPRTIAIILAGAGMSMCGLIMQQISKNKFVSPTTSGTTSAAGLGLLLSVALVPTGGASLKLIISFAVTLISSIIFMKIVEKIKIKNAIFIPLIGIMYGNVIDSISYFFAYKQDIVQNFNSWLIGDFSSIIRGRYEIIYISVPIIIITYLYADQFTIAGMGKSFSKSVGLSYNMVMNIGLMCVSLTSSIIILTVGTIPFLGLVIPNIVSILFGDNLRKTLPFTAIMGSLFLMICDIISRLIIFPYEVPIGLTVGIIGGIIFLILVIRGRRYA